MRKPTLLSICRHEAGHAIVQLATGPASWINYTEIDRPDEHKLGIVWTRAMWQPWMREAEACEDSVRHRQWFAAQDVVNFLAGDVAELRWRRETRIAIQHIADEMTWRCVDAPDPPADFGMARSRLFWLIPGDEEAGFVRAWHATEGVVALWWREIIRLGRELALRGSIEDKQLIPIWNQMRDARGAAAMH